MFGLFKAAVELVKLPVDIVADVVTLGDYESKDTYTGRRCRRIMRKLNED